MQFKSKQTEVWVLFLSFSISMPCLLLWGLFPIIYPVGLSMPVMLRFLDVKNVAGSLIFLVLLLPQLCAYLFLWFYISKKIFQHGLRRLSGGVKFLVLSGIALLPFLAWYFPMWGGHGFLDPHPLQKMSHVLRGFPTRGY